MEIAANSAKIFAQRHSRRSSLCGQFNQKLLVFYFNLDHILKILRVIYSRQNKI